MPELPEVETIARTLAPQIMGKRVVGVTVLNAKSLEAGEVLLPLVTGACIGMVRRRAKLLVIGLVPSSGCIPVSVDSYDECSFLPRDFSLFMVFHLKMTGRFFVHPANALPEKHTRLIFDLASTENRMAVGQYDTAGSAVGCGGGFALGEEPPLAGRLFFDDMRKFGYCRIMLRHEFCHWPFWQGLGPEPLETPSAMIATRLAAKKTSIKAALLNQSVVAGVGNIYADESLFRAGIAPSAVASSLSLATLNKLAEALQAVLQQSIDECGSSIRDYRDAKGNAGAFQNSFFVYGRKGEACHVCGTSIEATRVAGRGTAYCPCCQTMKKGE